jgi:hypothetical protein
MRSFRTMRQSRSSVAVGGERPFAARWTKGGSADKTDLDRNKHDGRFRPNADVRDTDQCCSAAFA